MHRPTTRFALLFVATIACAPETPAPPPLLAVAIPKTVFDSNRGWFFQKSIVSSPFNQKFVGDVAPWTSPIMAPVHVRLEFQENWLVAYKMNSGFSADADSTAIATPIQIEFSFPVRHIDLVANQLIDSPYRPWFERTHVVVDWAHPAIEPLGWVDLKPEDYGAERWVVWDPADPDRISFEPGRIDVTVRGKANVARLETYGFDLDFWCFDRDQPNCSGNEITTRLVMHAATPQQHYEPAPVIDTFSESTFPIFKVAHRHYSDEYGFTDVSKRALGIRFDTYVRSLNDDGTVIPTWERTLARRPVYLSPNWPRGAQDTLVPSVIEAYRRWNVALRTAVSSRRALDCQRAGASDCAARLAGDASWSYFVVCETNPVTQDEAAREPVCGPAGKRVRVGNMYDVYLYWDSQPYANSPQAFAYNNQDFGTGLNLGAFISFNASVADRSAMFVVDVLRVLNGDAAFRESYRSGKAISDWVRDRRLLSNTAFNYGNALSEAYEQAASTPTPLQPDPAAMSPAAVAEAVRRPDFSWLWHSTALQRPPDWTRFDVAAFLKPVVDRLSVEADLQQARRDTLRGTALERGLIGSDELLLAGKDPNTEPTEADLAMLSPLRVPVWKRLEAQRPISDTFADPYFFDPDVADYAARYRGQDLMATFYELRREQITWVLSHEIGHTMGLRHNFAGSFDAFNYPDEYWRLRNDGTAGPRYRDPVSPAERSAHIERFMTSSVMDYTPNFYYGIQSVGKYDQAVLKYLYGGVVEVLDGPRNRTPEARTIATQLVALNRSIASPPPLVADPADANRYSIHYTDFPRLLDPANRSDVLLSDLVNANNSPELIPGAGATQTTDGRVMVPFMGCHDAFTGRMGCLKEDLGADPYEIVEYSIRRARGYYLFTHFRRGLLGFPDRRSKIDLGTISELRAALGAAIFVNAVFGGDPRATAPGEGLENVAIAVNMAFDYLGELLTTPDVAPYALWQDPVGGRNLLRPSFRPNPTLTLDYNDARFFDPSFYTPTEYVGYQYPEFKRLGFVSNKRDAIDLAVTSGELGAALGFTNQQDTRRTLVSMYRLFPDRVNDWFGAILTDDTNTFAPGWDPATLSVVRPSWSAGTTAGTFTRLDPAFPILLKLRLITTGVPGLYTSGVTRNFADLSRIWVTGSGAQVSGVPTVAFVDAFSGKRYEAISFLQGAVERGIGARMLQRAAALQTFVQANPTNAEARAALEDMRLLIETTRLTVEKVERG